MNRRPLGLALHAATGFYPVTASSESFWRNATYFDRVGRSSRGPTLAREAYRMGFYTRTAEHLNGRFAHLEPEPITNVLADRKVTFYGALKMEMGMDRDLSVLAYENHEDLTGAIRAAFSTFDSLLTERTGAATRSDAWAMHPDRTEDEIVGLLTDADAADPTPFAETVTAVPRPGIHKLVGAGKYRAAVASEVCRLVAHTGRSFSEIVGSVLRPEQREDELLASLEHWRAKVASPGDHAVADLDLGALFTKAAGTWFRTSGDSSVVSFCAHLSDAGAIQNDIELRARLSQILKPNLNAAREAIEPR